MEVEMGDSLPGVLARIRHQPIAGFLYSFEHRDFRTGEKQSCKERLIPIPKILNCRNVLLRDDQRMDRSLGIDVVKGKRVLIFVHELGWNFLVDDLTEQTVHASSSAAVRSRLLLLSNSRFAEAST